jgi:hypothetical protein
MISEELDITYGSVLRVEKEFNEARVNGTLETLIDVDDMVMQSAATVLDVDQVTLTKGLKGLDKLSQDFQVTASQINTRVRSLIMSCDHLSELETAADIICSLNTAFVNSNSTAVNIQNNFGGENNAASRYAGYLSDVPAK